MLDALDALMFAKKSPTEIHAPCESRYQHPVEWPDPDAEARRVMSKTFHLAAERLSRWLTNPEELDDDDLDPPSLATIESALALLGSFYDYLTRSDEVEPGDLKRCVGVAPGPGGLIALEFRPAVVRDTESADQLLTLEVAPDGFVEYLVFADNRIVRRGYLPRAAPVS